MMRTINKFKRTKTNELAGMSKHALMMRLYKEMLKQLDKCQYMMDQRAQYSIGEFFETKSKCMTKVMSIASYLIDTTDMSADQEIGEVFIKMYRYIYINASNANMKIDAEAISRAKLMSEKLIDVWDSIPEADRY